MSIMTIVYRFDCHFFFATEEKMEGDNTKFGRVDGIRLPSRLIPSINSNIKKKFSGKLGNFKVRALNEYRT